MRASGILLHPTSLPGRHGIGDLGPEALRFADWLHAAGQRIWQVLPVGPVGYGESPYQLFSAFAGNPMLISLDVLRERGWLEEDNTGTNPAAHGQVGCATDQVEFERVVPWKTERLRRAYVRFRERAMAADWEELAEFRRERAGWLDDYARFMALKEANGGRAWTEWDPRVEADEGAEEYHVWTQLEFFRQWRALREYCGERGIRLMGDLPIYVAGDSADVWAHRDLFRFDAVAGVPPDYFSATGQLWGNPLYRWGRMAADGYRWWVERMRAALELFDLVRMDHFRGFEAYWAVPAGERTAMEGRWEKGPGAELFRVLERELGRLPLVAENLGVITPEVEAIREEFGFPGMAILQFAFGTDPQARTFLPHNYPRNIVAYTGTHDNDTVMGWWRGGGGASTRTAEDVEREKARARAYLATDGTEMNWTMIRALMASVADTVLFPMQDVLGLGSEARMNTPAVAEGNWRWRVRGEAGPGGAPDGVAARLKGMAEIYER